jgi:divalent metal cation (Fe/Co/Zn/Cd) transporter
MSIELAVSFISGVRAHSVALVAFGGDSAVELLSALVVLRRFRLGRKAERNAAKLSSVLLYLVGSYIVVTSALSFFFARFRPEGSISGIILLVVAAVVMPILGAAKKKLARETGSAALGADSLNLTFALTCPGSHWPASD